MNIVSELIESFTKLANSSFVDNEIKTKLKALIDHEISKMIPPSTNGKSFTFSIPSAETTKVGLSFNNPVINKIQCDIAELDKRVKILLFNQDAMVKDRSDYHPHYYNCEAFKCPAFGPKPIDHSTSPMGDK